MTIKESRTVAEQKPTEFTDKLKVLVVVLSLLGLGILYHFALEARPPLIPISKMGEHQGEMVRVRGKVTEMEYLPSDAVKLELREDNASCWIFLESPGEEFWLDPGDLVEAQGEVQDYLGRLELMVEQEEDLTLLKRSGNVEVFLSTLARQPWIYLDSPVTVSGELRYNISHYGTQGEDESGNELILLYLGDGAGVSSVKLRLVRGEAEALAWERALGLEAGCHVLVCATLRYASSDMRYFLSLEGEGASLEETFTGELP
jgi:hypothetical protein